MAAAALPRVPDTRTPLQKIVLDAGVNPFEAFASLKEIRAYLWSLAETSRIRYLLFVKNFDAPAYSMAQMSSDVASYVEENPTRVTPDPIIKLLKAMTPIKRGLIHSFLRTLLPAPRAPNLSHTKEANEKRAASRLATIRAKKEAAAASAEVSAEIVAAQADAAAEAAGDLAPADAVPDLAAEISAALEPGDAPDGDDLD